MDLRRPTLQLAGVLTLLVLGTAAVGLVFLRPPAPAALADPGSSVPLAILGNSDSHSYGDTVGIPEALRGGAAFHDITLQWTEILARLRPEELDLGTWGVWGTRYRWVVLRRILGLSGRYPVKLDFRYNLAVSGATCGDLLNGRRRQLPALLSILRRKPERWSDGVVVIRIGINSLSSDAQLAHYAAEGLDAVSREWAQRCLDPIGTAARVILEENPGTRIVLAGIAEDINGASRAHRFESPEAVRGIREVLDHFDDALRDLADAEPRVAFVGDRAWWFERWGGRHDSGAFRPRSVSLGGLLEVTNTIGNHPSNAVLVDGHAGTVVNGLWANELIRVLNGAFGLGLTPLSLDEIASLVNQLGS